MQFRFWLVAPAAALAFLLWVDHGRAQRVASVTAMIGADAPAGVGAADSATGYALGQRELIVPERNENSFAWIAQTQQMLARGDWRVRHIDYENAPFGREVQAPSPYRWWLAVVAWFDHVASGRPLGLSVERAAMLADPILQAVFFLGCVALVGGRFGALAGALIAVGLAGVFPFAAEFLPGAPDSRGLSILCAMGSMLFLLAGVKALYPGPSAPAPGKASRWMALAGVVGGLGLWINVSIQVPVLGGIFLGGLLAAGVTGRRTADDAPAGPGVIPWRAWSVSGGLTVLVCYLAECYPDDLGSWRLESIHPLYGLAWFGAGELLVRAVAWIRSGRPAASFRDSLVVILSLAALVAIPWVRWKTSGAGFLERDLLWARLTSLPGGVTAGSFSAWLARDGVTGAVSATALPLVVALLGSGLMLRRATAPENRTQLAIALGPVVIALGFACQQISWWGLLDGMLLVLLVAATSRPEAAGSRPNRWLWATAVALMIIPGVIQLRPAPAGAGFQLTSSESEELIERHLAQWLTRQAGEPGVVVYAPPHQTTTLSYFGGLRGLGTFAVGNRAGFGTSLAIAGVTTMEEVRELLRGRGVRYVVLPSWDPFFDEFARLYLAKNFSNRTSFFINELRRWNIPGWLRPVPYQLPVSGGFSGQSVLVFEVVDDQSPVVAASRLAEYLVETGELDQATAVSESLKRFPGDVGALAARAQVQGARNDSAGMAQTVGVLLARLSNGGDRYLPWDRRVSLAMVLTRADRAGLARDQVKRCLAEADEARVRALSTGSLYGLQVLAKAFGLEFADPRLRALAMDLLPPDVRSRL
jgi:hypothetical protein